ncbi:SAM-dependent methyltransferase [Streptomyces sp. ISL-96]|uniref:SAM-dependent methyltransferase n=1 Tax=Streptomyces sp. ISL-96 TaxID=2819191 RepID=UPI001BE94F93|nr:SAM-dependent methyltransferase [Streptomyces sp. ISL-96]MBT2491069.1 SAM-dependent methyltransferase [Streptomyces sp. ISL-96]
MTPTLVRHHRHHANAASAPTADAGARARDWAEIQERMLVPLYEAAYARLEVGPATRLLGLDCGSGLALLIAASRGARVTGVEADPDRVALARERLSGTEDTPDEPTRLYEGESAEVCDGAAPAYNLITAFEPLGCAAGDSEGLAAALTSAIPLAERGSAVVLVGWGPPERCATSSVLRVASRLTETLRATGGGGAGRGWRPALRDDLEDAASRAGLKPDGSGRVACPFGYADMDSAVRGLLSTGLFDAAVRATDPAQVEKELVEALHPHVRRDGTVWMSNVFRYLIARTP